MSDQPYPSSAAAAPPSVVNAVRLMYAGAAVSALSLILSVATIGSLRTSLRKANPKLTAAQLHTLQTGFVVALVVAGLIGIGLWVLMALMNKAGKSWARIFASVLFALNTILLLLSFVQAGTSAASLAGILTWLIGLGAVILLWQRASSEYFTAQSAPAPR
jgi:hypothetical protein